MEYGNMLSSEGKILSQLVGIKKIFCLKTYRGIP